MIDGNGPAQIAEHVPTGIAALAADGTNFYVATYSTLYAYNRQSGNQDGQWTMPAVPTANSSNNDLVALAAANGTVFVSVTRGNTVSVYTVNPGTSAAPHLLLSGLGDAIGSDGSVYYERTDHHLAARRPNGAPPSARCWPTRRTAWAAACSTSTWWREAPCGSASPPARASMRRTPPTTPPRSTSWGPTTGR